MYTHTHITPTHPGDQVQGDITAANAMSISTKEHILRTKEPPHTLTTVVSSFGAVEDTSGWMTNAKRRSYKCNNSYFSLCECAEKVIMKKRVLAPVIFCWCCDSVVFSPIFPGGLPVNCNNEEGVN